MEIESDPSDGSDARVQDAPEAAEVACIAVHPLHRDGQQANRLLAHLKREAMAQGGPGRVCH
jgi:N-acetylglutamate synthase-like GNAT family acetyltransferase